MTNATTLPNPNESNSQAFRYHVGQLLTFEYLDDANEWRTTTVVVTLIDDDGIMGKDLEADEERSFYLDAMRNVRPDSWLQLELYEEDDEPWWYHPRVFAPIVRDQLLLKKVIDGFAKRVANRPEITSRLRVVPFDLYNHAPDEAEQETNARTPWNNTTFAKARA